MQSKAFLQSFEGKLNQNLKASILQSKAFCNRKFSLCIRKLPFLQTKASFFMQSKAFFLQSKISLLKSKASFLQSRKKIKNDKRRKPHQLQCQRKLLSCRFTQTIPFLVDLKVTRLDRCPPFQQKARDFLAFQPRNKFNELCLTKRTMKRVANGFSMKKSYSEEKVSLL